jgi:hypothetical protein
MNFWGYVSRDQVGTFDGELGKKSLKYLERYCPAKTDRGRKWHQSKGLPFALNGQYFIFTFKGNPLLNWKKAVSEA